MGKTYKDCCMIVTYYIKENGDRIPVSPDARMNAMNVLNAENQTARGQSGLGLTTVHSEQNYNAPTAQILNDRIDNKAIPGQNDIA